MAIAHNSHTFFIPSTQDTSRGLNIIPASPSPVAPVRHHRHQTDPTGSTTIGRRSKDALKTGCSILALMVGRKSGLPQAPSQFPLRWFMLVYAICINIRKRVGTSRVCIGNTTLDNTQHYKRHYDTINTTENACHKQAKRQTNAGSMLVYQIYKSQPTQLFCSCYYGPGGEPSVVLVHSQSIGKSEVLNHSLSSTQNTRSTKGVSFEYSWSVPPSGHEACSMLVSPL